jgi:hypothetical protein
MGTIVSKQELAHCSLQAKSSSQPFVNKVLLEHSHTHYFTYFLWMLIYYNDRMMWL